MTESSKAYTFGRYFLAGGVVIFAIGQSLLFIVVAPLARSIGLTEVQFGITFSLANISLILAGPYWGRRSDVIGRKPVFIIGLFGSSIGILLMAYTLNLGMQGALATGGLMAMIFASRALYGLTASSIYPSAAGYIADVTAWHERAKGMALIGSANSLGSIVGPAIGGALTFMGVLYPMYAAATISMLGGIATIIWLMEPEQHAQRKASGDKDKPKIKFTDKRLRPYMIMWVNIFLFFISLNFVTAFYIQDQFGITDMARVMRTASVLLVCMAAVITLIQGVLFQFIKISPFVLLRLTAPLFGTGLFTMAFAPNIVVLGLGFAILGGAFACATPGINGSASLAVEPHEQGTAAGYLSASNTSGAIMGPLVGPLLYYYVQPNAPFLIGGTVMAILSIYALTIPAPQQRKTASA
ncbi:MAG: MFS transporter [Gammaproteobacteria bacterium]|jgi:MFS family permease|nr:MFS transporter [Gammaproteobacteria bacterium]MDP6696058.1 MFS transporter [Gammaproteobacteria bacterium]